MKLGHVVVIAWDDKNAMTMLKSWTTKRPSADLLDVWCHYSKSLAASLNGPTRTVLQKEVVEQVETVARSSGGVLGFGSISASEKAIIARVKDALD